MNERQGTRSIPAILWPVVLGGVGFLVGFIGPVTFNPEANQGPLFGIFISGPCGALLGLFLGLICRGLKFSVARQWGVLTLSVVLLALVTLSFCFPNPQLRGYAMEVQIDKCQPPAQVIDAAIEYWNGRIAKVTWTPPRPEWQQDARDKAQTADGVVLDVTVLRGFKLEENRKPWNKGVLSASNSHPGYTTRSYYADYAGKSCSDYHIGQKTMLFSPYDLAGMSRGAGDWPPRNLADFLDRAVLEKLPDDYRTVLPQ